MTFLRPTNAKQALSLLDQYQGQILAGGTDLYALADAPVQLAKKALLDITEVTTWASIDNRSDSLWIGAGVKLAQLRDATLPSCCHALQQACGMVGGSQFQNRGTLVGNVCNASPAADTVPPLMALNAVIEVASVTGTRRVPIGDFILAPRRVDLAANEMVTGISLVLNSNRQLSYFNKLGGRKYLVISIAMVAVNITIDEQLTVISIGIAVGACSAVAQRLVMLEGDCLGLPVQQLAAKVEARHVQDLNPLDDLRASAHYRRQSVVHLLRGAFTILAEEVT